LGLFFWTLVAFLAVFFILKNFAWKPILKALDERESGIADSIAEASRIKAEMAQLQADNQNLLRQAREEKAAILKEANASRNSIIAGAKESAKQEAAKSVADAQMQIEHQKQAALIDVKNQIGILAIEVAEKVLRKDLASESEQNKYAKVLAEEIKLN